ncbi:peptidylprolyl isomerase [Spirulina sp. 06S082]|uniref:peptidylprolyl isomerase n=1 Tax=Spirulina sp. 06S082 TaxID=3110248 RepID=UPI002B207B52|nr:peptidylprolyl isomerase [Spirulina sp. 06S082]MEA5469536.1 peptidylprolyl isomerase [Spirulina sp. 06S082]
MSAVLQVGDRQLDSEQVISLLTSPQILPHLLREIIIDSAIASVACTREELEQFCQNITQQPQNSGISPQQIARVAPRQLKLEKFKEAQWGAQVEAEFLSNKEQYDRVLFSIIQSEELEVIQELYFRLQEEEAAFGDLAGKYSQGPEAHSNGLVGPIALHNLHPKLAQMLRISQPGQISPPFRVDKWVAIARLERYIPTKFDTALRQRLIASRFEAWLEAQIAKESRSLNLAQDIQLPERLLSSQKAQVLEVEEVQDEIEPDNSTTEAIEVSDSVTFEAISTRPEPENEPDPLAKNSAKMAQKWRSYKPLGIREAAVLALIPLALGGWSVAAFFGFGTQGSPFSRATEAGIPSSGRAEAASEETFGVPHKEAFRVAVNHAMSAADLTQTAATPEDWDRVSQNWQQAIALMRVVPVDHKSYTVAREKVIEYQGYLEYASQQAQNPNGVFRAAINQAIAAVNATEIARFPEEWEQAVQDWTRAIELMETVSEDHPQYETAREKAIEYQTYLAYAQGKVN